MLMARRRGLWAVVLLALEARSAVVPPSPCLQLYVDPRLGHDLNDGRTSASSLRTVAAAQRRVRAALASEREQSVVVQLSPGRHRVPSGGLLLDASHSPADGHAVYWLGTRGASAVSGGELVTGWKLAGDPAMPSGIYSAPAPAALRGRTARHLFVDGARAARTRRNVSSALPGLMLSTDPTCVACTYSANSTELLSWSNPGEVEFVYSGVIASWAEQRCAVDRVHAGRAGVNVTMKQPCFWNLIMGRPLAMGDRLPLYVENVREHLSSPGQWYFDSSEQKVFYFPFAGQRMDTVEVVVAVEETLVKHDGASNHKWDGVTFEYGTWLRPMQNEGYVEEQTGACDICPYSVELQAGCGKHDSFIATPGNVAISSGRNIEFSNCSFRHLGAYAASARNGSQNISWRGCDFVDASAGAIALGDVTTWSNGDSTQWDQNFTVEDCMIANLPVEFTGAAAIFGGYVASTHIQHNHIANTSYSGISLGWGWGREASRRGDNHVIANKIERVLLSGRCCDGGGVYTLGPQPGSSIRENYILHADVEIPGYGPFGHGGHAIYHDQGSGGFTDTANVLDGPWDTWATVRPFGWQCPGASGQQVDCRINVTDNWVRSNGTSTCSVRSATCHKVDPGFSVAGNIRIEPNAALPPAAAAVVVAAGPRYDMPAKSDGRLRT